MRPSVLQSVHPTAGQPVSQSVRPSVRSSVLQPVNHPARKPVRQTVSKCEVTSSVQLTIKTEIISVVRSLCLYYEPVWPSGKALGSKAEGPRLDFASARISLQKKKKKRKRKKVVVCGHL